jgi:hypothetical protein
MPAYFILGVIGLMATLYGLSWATRVNPATLARFLRYAGIAAAVIVFLLLAFTGKIGLLFLVGPPVAFFWWRWRQARLAAEIGAAPSGRTSGIETGYLSVSLDHDTGTVDGRIKVGKFKDRRLADLTLADLLELLGELRQSDSEGVAVLEAYLDRLHAGWRTSENPSEEANAQTASRPGTMTREEALEVLGLAAGASVADIREAHHRLMMKVHPDHGGSSYLAARLNEARDRLLVN